MAEEGIRPNSRRSPAGRFRLQQEEYQRKREILVEGGKGASEK